MTELTVNLGLISWILVIDLIIETDRLIEV